ncbi:exodeoxyribonuclease VII small subunit [Kineococcus terrestris]|uniref:exodeoxyribonuclease VII small subunit n=1 Tax=Kineococcus terrestris TaxID=2044856 RepID=UPI00359F830D
MPDQQQPPASPGSPATAGVEDLGYEQARDELVDVVRRLEAGGTGLEEALALWERGEALADRCTRWLEGARARLDAGTAAAGGSDEDDEPEDDARG